MDFLRLLFDTSSFPARWYCGDWSPLHGWIHVVSDTAIWGAYTAIPITIIYFTRHRTDLPHPRVLLLFAAFIIACGTTHLIEAGIFWWPVYRLSAVAKATTAVVSWLTVVALFFVVPRVLRYPGLERLNQQLELANRDLDDFAYVVSHDLRAPLRGVHTLSEWIREEVGEAQPATMENLEELQRRVRRMDQLIQGVLAYSRAGRGGLTKEKVDTRALAEEVAGCIQPREGVFIEVRGTMPVVHASRTQLFQIFQNLLDNAVKYSAAEGGQVCVYAREAHAEWVFSVEDNGPGIAPRHHERIFKLFQRGHQENDPEAIGGMGLAIVKRLVEVQGGRTWVESQPGAGSTFHFSLPKNRSTPLEKQPEGTATC